MREVGKKLSHLFDNLHKREPPRSVEAGNSLFIVIFMLYCLIFKILKHLFGKVLYLLLLLLLLLE